MKVNFSEKLVNLNGEQIKDSDSNEDLILKTICVGALLTNEKALEGKDKLERFELAKEIHTDKKDSISAEEVVLLKELIGKFYPTMVVGQVYQMLDGE